MRKLQIMTIIGIVLSLTFSFSSETYAKITRSCLAYYNILINDENLLLLDRSIDIGYFHATGGCGELVPDRCRERASSYAAACMETHAQNLDSTAPSQCMEESGVYNYHIQKMSLREYLQGEICDYLNYVGKQNVATIPIKVMAKIVETKGEGCGLRKDLTEFTIDCQSKFNNTLLRPNVQQKTISMTDDDGSPFQRYVKTVDKCADENNNPICSNDISLFLTENDMLANNIFSVDEEYDYQGCGVKAAQNVLRYFDIHMSQERIAPYVGAYKVGREIFTVPKELREGLQEILDNHRRNIKVDRYNNKTSADIRHYLEQGYPVLALVKRGTHWVLISGVKAGKISPEYEHDQFYIQDMNDTDIWPEAELELEFGDGGNATEDLLRILFFGGTEFQYREGTIIVFSGPEALEYQPLAPLQVLENPTNQKVVFDDVHDKYWFWDLSALAGQTYAQQIAAIDELNADAYFGMTGWHLASFEEMQQIWPSYQATQNQIEAIAQSFNFSSTPDTSGNIYAGRYDMTLLDTTPSSHGVLTLSNTLDGLYYSPLKGWLFDDFAIDFTLSSPIPISAWIVTDASNNMDVIPEPASLLLFVTGIIGLLTFTLRRRNNQ